MMKEKQPALPPVAKTDWDRLMHANIYMGDHMTRSWTKDGRVTSQIGSKSTPGTPDNRDPRGSPADRKTSIKKGKEVCEPSCAQVNPQVSFRKPNGKRRIKSAKELILHCTIKPHDLEEWNVSFDSLLKSPAGRFVFRVFLESEIADENLKFWLACEDLKNTTKQKRIEKRIQDIYDTYINVYSPHEVNIDYKMRENIVDQLKDKVDVSIFTEAQHQIYTLMHRDSYPRFLSSSLTAEITKEVMEQNQRAEDLNTKPDRSFEFISCCCYRRQGSIRRPLHVVEEQPSSLKPTAASNRLNMDSVESEPRRDSISSSEYENIGETQNDSVPSNNIPATSAMNGARPSASPPVDSLALT